MYYFLVTNFQKSPSAGGHPKGGFIQNATANAVCGVGLRKTN